MTQLLDADRVPHNSLRRTEAYLRRQTRRIEEQSAARLQALYAEAYRDLRDALERTDRRDALDYAVRARIGALGQQVAALVDTATRAALVGNYYGRVWMLDSATRADVRVPVQPLVTLREDIYDSLIRDLLGETWSTQFDVEMDDLIVGIRRAIGTGMIQNERADAIARRVASAMGVTIDRRRGARGSAERRGYRANFNRVQVLTRTVVNTVANEGALQSYKAHRDLLSGYEWLTADDERVCPVCAALDGKQFAIKGRFRPPAHPQCRCTIVPVVKASVLDDPKRAVRVPFLQWARQYGIEREVNDFLDAR